MHLKACDMCESPRDPIDSALPARPLKVQRIGDEHAGSCAGFGNAESARGGGFVSSVGLGSAPASGGFGDAYDGFGASTHGLGFGSTVKHRPTFIHDAQKMDARRSCPRDCAEHVRRLRDVASGQQYHWARQTLTFADGRCC